MKYPFIVLLLLSIISVNAQLVNPRPAKSFIMDTSKGSATLRQCSRTVPAPAQAYWQITNEDANALEKNLGKLCALVGSNVTSLDNFYFQYAGLVIKGKKYIYINAFPKSTEKEFSGIQLDFRKEPVVICDGGRGFWGVLYEIEAGVFSQLSFNGYA